MTKKHFITAAKIVKDGKLKDFKPLTTLQKVMVATAFIQLFQSEDNKFEVHRFMIACDIK